MNTLIFGKDDTQGITNISHKNDAIHIFREEEHTVIPYKPWMLSPDEYNGSVRLEGTQHYKWLNEFSSYKEFEDRRSKVYTHDLYAVWNQCEAYMLRSGATYYKGLKLKDVSVLSFDIETDGLRHTADSKVFLISNTYRRGDYVEKRLFNLKDYNDNCGSLIRAWCSFVVERNPSIMLGHNILCFDLPYLRHVAELYDTDLFLGRDRSAVTFDSYVSKKRKDGSQAYEYNNATVFGRDIVDTFFMALTYDIGRKYESYGLKQIIKQEGMEKHDRTFIDASKIAYYYNDVSLWDKVCAYAEEDSEDSLKLFDLMAPANFYFTRSVPKTFQQMVNSATGSQLNSIMVRSYLQDNHSVAKADSAVEYEGAISLGIPGIYKNCIRWDVSSLYPSIMRQYKIFSKDKDPKEHLPKMIEYFAIERLANKKLAKETGDRYYKDLEQCQKVAANSIYGFLGARGLNYNYPAGAALVTKYGREILEKAVYWASGKKVNDLRQAYAY